MLRLQNSGREAIGRVSRFDSYPFLRNNRPAVECFVGEVYRGARLFGTAREHRGVHPPAVHPRAAEIGQQGRVDVDNAAAKPGDYSRRHELQVPSQHHELRVSERGEQLRGVARILEHDRRHAGLTRAAQRPGIGPVRDDAGNACERGFAEGIEEGLQVRAAA